MNHEWNLQTTESSAASAVIPESDSESAFPFFKAYKTDTLNCGVMAHFIPGLFAPSSWHGFPRIPYLPFRHY